LGVLLFIEIIIIIFALKNQLFFKNYEVKNTFVY